MLQNNGAGSSNRTNCYITADVKIMNSTGDEKCCQKAYGLSGWLCLLLNSIPFNNGRINMLYDLLRSNANTISGLEKVTMPTILTGL